VQIVMVVIYCAIAVLILFGLTFHDELLGERQRKRQAAKFIVIEGGKSKLRRRA
jgi:hypothetical protein